MSEQSDAFRALMPLVETDSNLKKALRGLAVIDDIKLEMMAECAQMLCADATRTAFLQKLPTLHGTQPGDLMEWYDQLLNDRPLYEELKAVLLKLEPDVSTSKLTIQLDCPLGKFEQPDNKLIITEFTANAAANRAAVDDSLYDYAQTNLKLAESLRALAVADRVKRGQLITAAALLCDNGMNEEVITAEPALKELQLTDEANTAAFWQKTLDKTPQYYIPMRNLLTRLCPDLHGAKLHFEFSSTDAATPTPHLLVRDYRVGERDEPGVSAE